MLHIGIDIAREASVEPEYLQALESAVAYLLDHQQRHGLMFRDTFNRGYQRMTWPWDAGRKWDSGLYFSASAWTLAQWRSEAYTAAMVLEALSKYVMAYELGGVDIQGGRRIRAVHYARNADRAGSDFDFVVE